MTDHQSDAILLLRLARTQSGVRNRHIPETLIETVADFGGHVAFQGDRIFIRESETVLRRLKALARRGSAV